MICYRAAVYFFLVQTVCAVLAFAIIRLVTGLSVLLSGVYALTGYQTNDGDFQTDTRSIVIRLSESGIRLFKILRACHFTPQ